MVREAVAVDHAGITQVKQGLPATTARSVFSAAAASRGLYQQDGQTFGEYSLILTLVVVIAAAGLSPLGSSLSTLITNTVAAVIAML